MKSYLAIGLLLGLASAHKHHHVQGQFVENRIRNLLESSGNLEGGVVRSTIGPGEDQYEHLDSMKEDSDEAQYQKDSPAGYNNLQLERFLAQQHREYMQMKAQDLEIVPVKYTGKAIGESYIGPDKDELENGSADEQMNRHSDDDSYDEDSPAGYRNALTRD